MEKRNRKLLNQGVIPVVLAVLTVLFLIGGPYLLMLCAYSPLNPANGPKQLNRDSYSVIIERIRLLESVTEFDILVQVSPDIHIETVDVIVGPSEQDPSTVHVDCAIVATRWTGSGIRDWRTSFVVPTVYLEKIHLEFSYEPLYVYDAIKAAQAIWHRWVAESSPPFHEWRDWSIENHYVESFPRGGSWKLSDSSDNDWIIEVLVYARRQTSTYGEGQPVYWRANQAGGYIWIEPKSQ